MGVEHGTQRIPTPDELRAFLQQHVSARRSYAAYNLLKPLGWKHAQLVVNAFGCNAVTTSEGWRRLVEQTLGGEIGKTTQAHKTTTRMASAATSRVANIHSHGRRTSGN